MGIFDYLIFLIIRCVYKVLYFLFNLVYQIEINGLENISKSKLIISNHVSEMDILFINFLSPVLIRFISDNKVKKIPIVGKFAELTKCIFIDRDSRAFEQIDKQFTISDIDIPLVIFPEGTLFYDDMIKKRLNNNSYNQIRYKHVLAPKTKGYEYILEKYKKLNYPLKNIVSICIKYQIDDYTKALTIGRWFKLQKKKIFINIELYPIETSLETIFENNDKILDKIYF